MTNKEILEKYNDNTEVMEDFLVYFLMAYFDLWFPGQISKMPINPVTFTKDFLKKKTSCRVNPEEKARIKEIVEKGMAAALAAKTAQ